MPLPAAGAVLPWLGPILNWGGLAVGTAATVAGGASLYQMAPEWMPGRGEPPGTRSLVIGDDGIARQRTVLPDGSPKIEDLTNDTVKSYGGWAKVQGMVDRKATQRIRDNSQKNLERINQNQLDLKREELRLAREAGQSTAAFQMGSIDAQNFATTTQANASRFAQEQETARENERIRLEEKKLPLEEQRIRAEQRFQEGTLDQARLTGAADSIVALDGIEAVKRKSARERALLVHADRRQQIGDIASGIGDVLGGLLLF